MSKSMQFKARMKNLALKHHVPAQAVLQNFMLERLLERISLSRYKNWIILKGFPLTKETLQSAFTEICALPLDDSVDLVFKHIEPIREDDEYGGFRVAILGRYDSINTPLKIDVTTGDVITPGAVCYAYPSNFENKRFEVWAYTIETILAEKVETILRRSVLNTRLRDFYDVYILMKTQCQAINLDIFQSALQATAKKRLSLEVLREKEKVIQAIQADTVMRQRWDRYCKEHYYASGIPFDDVIDILINLIRSNGQQ